MPMQLSRLYDLYNYVSFPLQFLAYKTADFICYIIMLCYQLHWKGDIFQSYNVFLYKKCDLLTL